MIYHSDNDFVRCIKFDGPRPQSAVEKQTRRHSYRSRLNSLHEIVDKGQTSFSFISRENNLEEALVSYAHVMKTPLDMRDQMAQKREEFISKFDFRSFDYGEEKLLSLLGNQGHPSSNFASGNMEALSDKMDDETLYQRIEEFKSRHYSAHRMSLCLQTNLSLDEMQVRSQ